MRYKKDNQLYNLGHAFSNSVTWTKSQKIKRALRSAIIQENILGLAEYDEVPNVKVRKLTPFQFRVRIRNVGAKHDTIINSGKPFSGALRGQFREFEFGTGHDVNGMNFVEFNVDDKGKDWQLKPYDVEDFDNPFGIVKIDNRQTVDTIKNGHWVISGHSGSGKSTFLMTLLAQLLRFRTYVNTPDLYLVDFKEGELSRLYQHSDLPAHHFSNGTDGNLVKLLESVETIRVARQQTTMREPSLTTTAYDYNYAPLYVVIEELGAGLTLLNKKDRDRAVALIRNIAMKGRSALVHLIIVSQQASVQGTGLSTDILDQLNNKVLMGAANAQQRTYLMPGFDLPNKDWPLGSGWGYFYSDGIIEPYEFQGAFPVKRPDDWLFNVLIDEINETI